MKRCSVLIILLLLPLAAAAQEEAVKNAIQFMEGGSIIEDWFMQDFLGTYKQILIDKSSLYVDIGKSVAGCFTILYFALQAWNMMTGDKELKIIPLLKPFGLLMLILNWQLFITIIDAPMVALANVGEDLYLETVDVNRNLRFTRYQYQLKLADNLAGIDADNQIAKETADKAFLEKAWDNTGQVVIDKILKPIYAYKAKIATSIQLILTQLLELLSLWILRICVYVIFLLQMIFTVILVFLGPISVAFSITPMFSNALKYWLARYIAVQFYLVVAFLVLTASGYLQRIAFMQEIDRYSKLIQLDGTIVSLEKMMWIHSNGILSFGLVIITFLVSAIAICSVPKISTWIIPTGGTGGVGGGLSRQAGMMITRGLMK